MSRSYHVTEKMAREAFYQGDVASSIDYAEKWWVKTTQAHASRTGAPIPNRAIVSIEKKHTARRRAKSESKET